jgi:NAD(P)-dependent dehydrogenase (short-subunit alcohol dehydrogenase family)
LTGWLVRTKGIVMKFEKGLGAVVTGGASGLGMASARALAVAGFKVAILDLNEAAGEALAAELGGVFCKANILSEEEVLAAYAKARAAHGQERVLVHCAQVGRSGKTVGWDKATGAFKRFPTEDYAFAAQGILIASYRMASIAALGMAATEPLNEDGERGAIVLTSSVAAQEGQVGQIAYGSIKAGINGLVLPMARDLMDLGIRVNSIMPGAFATPPMLAFRDRAPEVYDNLGKSVPFPKRLGHPEEFASLVLELVRNNYMNGQTLRLDGAVRMPPR